MIHIAHVVAMRIAPSKEHLSGLLAMQILSHSESAESAEWNSADLRNSLTQNSF